MSDPTFYNSLYNYFDTNQLDIVKGILNDQDKQSPTYIIILFCGLCISLRNNNLKLFNLICQNSITKDFQSNLIKYDMLKKSLEIAIKNKYNTMLQSFINTIGTADMCFHYNTIIIIYADIIRFSLIHNNLDITECMIQTCKQIFANGDSLNWGLQYCTFYVYQYNNLKIIHLFNTIPGRKHYYDMFKGIIESKKTTKSINKILVTETLEMIKQAYSMVDIIPVISYFANEIKDILRLCLPDHVDIAQLILHYVYKIKSELNDIFYSLFEDIILQHDCISILPLIRVETSFIKAAHSGNIAVVKYLLNNNKDITIDTFDQAINSSFEFGNFELLLTLYLHNKNDVLQFIKNNSGNKTIMYLQESELRKYLILHNKHSDLLSLVSMCYLYIFSAESDEQNIINNNIAIQCFNSPEFVTIDDPMKEYRKIYDWFPFPKDNNSIPPVEKKETTTTCIQSYVSKSDTNLSFNYAELITTTQRDTIMVKGSIYVAKYQQWRNGLRTLLQVHKLSVPLIEHYIYKFI